MLPRDVVLSVSPVAARWPAQTRFPLDEMIGLMVAQSDNTAVETLFRVGGGSAAMADRFRQWKVEGVRVDRSEREGGLDRNGVRDYPPPDEWTDSRITALVDGVPLDEKYRATKRYLHEALSEGSARHGHSEWDGSIAGAIIQRGGAFEIVDYAVDWNSEGNGDGSGANQGIVGAGD